MYFLGVTTLGTNYYAERSGERTHLGKSSAGWKFLFKAVYSDHPRSDALQDWLRLVMTRAIVIRDEYGDLVEKELFLAEVLGKQQLHDHDDYDPELFGPRREVFEYFRKDNWTIGGLNFTDVEFS